MKTKYFIGTEEIDGRLDTMCKKEFERTFPGIKGVSSDSFENLVIRGPNEEKMAIDRIVYFKSNPKLHKCDARCRNAKGHSCECSCGGKFHGAG